jgi:hypothetical protein
METGRGGGRGGVPVTLLLQILALMFLGIFVVVWLWIAWDLWHFDWTFCAMSRIGAGC